MELNDKQIETRPVVLELQYGGNITKLHYTIASKFAYEKLMPMSAKQAVDLLLDHHEDRNAESTELEGKIRKFIENEKDLYTIQLPVGVLRCEVERNNLYTAKTDERNAPIRKYLEDLCDTKGRLVWAARMYLVEKTILG